MSIKKNGIAGVMSLKGTDIAVFRIYKGFHDRHPDGYREPKQITEYKGELQTLLEALPKAHWVEIDRTLYRGFATKFNGHPRKMLYQIDVHGRVGRMRLWRLTVWRPRSAFEVYFASQKVMYGWIKFYTKGKKK